MKKVILIVALAGLIGGCTAFDKWAEESQFGPAQVEAVAGKVKDDIAPLLPPPAGEVVSGAALLAMAIAGIWAKRLAGKAKDAVRGQREALNMVDDARGDVEEGVKAITTLTTWIEEVVVPKLTPAEIDALRKRQETEHTRLLIQDVRGKNVH